MVHIHAHTNDARSVLVSVPVCHHRTCQQDQSASLRVPIICAAVLVQSTLLLSNQQEKLMVHLDWYKHLRCESHAQQGSLSLCHEWMRKCKGEKGVQDNKSITYKKAAAAAAAAKKVEPRTT